MRKFIKKQVRRAIEKSMPEIEDENKLMRDRAEEAESNIREIWKNMDAVRGKAYRSEKRLDLLEVDNFRVKYGVADAKSVAESYEFSTVARPMYVEREIELAKKMFENMAGAGIFENVRKDEFPQYHNRKIWEWVYIIRVLENEGKLKSGSKGLGFAVGEEPLASYFANSDCEILASDLAVDKGISGEWAKDNQHASSLQQIFKPELVSRAKFDKSVRFEPIDMNDIPKKLDGKFDFVWSSCSMEHLGSLEKGKKFANFSAKCLVPGGIAVHTTEINLSSNYETVGEGKTSVFRPRDFEEMERNLEEQGYEVLPLDFRLDDSELDQIITYPPYPSRHYKLLIHDFVSTSFGMIIRRPR